MSKYTPVVKCTAKSKRTGQPCQRPAINGTGKCYHHGGKSLGGVASPTFKTGRFSKFLPTRLLDTYQDSLDDPKLWELSEKAALLNARLAELLRRLDTGESGATWAALRVAWGEMKQAINTVDAAAMMRLLAVIDSLIEVGNRDRAAWDEISGLINLFKGLSESERKHLDHMDRVMTAEQVMIMIAAITDVIRQNVSDKKQLSAISAGITRLITVDPGE